MSAARLSESFDGFERGDAYEPPPAELADEYEVLPDEEVAFDLERDPFTVAERMRLDLKARTRNQIDAARRRMGEDYSRRPSLPWDSVHDLVGELLPDQFWVLAAPSGHGKSTVLMSLVNHWLGEGRRIYMLPLEQPTDAMRQILAAVRCGYHPPYVRRNRWHKLPHDARERLEADLAWQAKAGADLLHFSDESFIDVRGLEHAASEAKAFGAEVMIVDYLGRVQLDGRGSHADFKRMVQRNKELAKTHRITMFHAQQINREATRGDPLGSYKPPHVDHIEGGKVVEQEADVVLGVYRPLVSDISKADLAELRMGTKQVADLLAPNTVGMAVLKNRIEGKIGHVVKLEYRHGQITCPKTETRVILGRERER